MNQSSSASTQIELPLTRKSTLSAASLRRVVHAAFIVLVVAFLVLPVVVVMLASVTSTDYLAVPPVGFSMRWFAAVFENADYIAAFRTSLLLALASTVGSVAIGCAAAYALIRRNVPYAGAISSMLMAPMVFPGVVIGIALLQYLSHLRLQGSVTGLFFTHMLICVPYSLRSVLSSIAGIDSELESAATTLGASRIQAFRLVTLPLLAQGVVAAALFSFVTSFDDVSTTIFLLGPDQMTLPVKIFSAIEYGVDPSVAALSTLLIVATALVLAAANKLVGLNRLI